MIMGLKQYGFTHSFYRTFPHVDGRTNLAIEVVMSEIEVRLDDCLQNGKLFPRNFKN
jgi:hypothetical protein